jgi:hypothetical protein
VVRASEGDRKDAICRLTAKCPSFPDWTEDSFYVDDDGTAHGHLVMIQLAGHLLDRLEARDTSELEKVLDEAERIVTEEAGRPGETPEMATYALDMVCTGLIESLYNNANARIEEGRHIRLKAVRERLGPECLECWINWDEWCRERKWPGEETAQTSSAEVKRRRRSRGSSKSSPRRR